MEADATVKDNEMKGPLNASTDVRKEITSSASNDSVALSANPGKRIKEATLVLYFAQLELLIVDFINLPT